MPETSETVSLPMVEGQASLGKVAVPIDRCCIKRIFPARHPRGRTAAPRMRIGRTGATASFTVCFSLPQCRRTMPLDVAQALQMRGCRMSAHGPLTERMHELPRPAGSPIPRNNACPGARCSPLYQESLYAYRVRHAPCGDPPRWRSGRRFVTPATLRAATLDGSRLTAGNARQA